MSESISFFRPRVSRHSRFKSKLALNSTGKPLTDDVFNCLFNDLTQEARNSYMKRFPDSMQNWAGRDKDHAVLAVLWSGLDSDEGDDEVHIPDLDREDIFLVTTGRSGHTYWPSLDLLGPLQDTNMKIQDIASQERISQKEARAWLTSRSKVVSKEYTKFSPRIKYVEAVKTNYLNAWVSPWWLPVGKYSAEDWVYKKTKATKDKEVEELFSHLFKNEESRAMAYRWLRDAFFSRAQSALVLTGVQGSGKNTFTDIIYNSLRGRNLKEVQERIIQTNAYKAPKSIKTSSFNGYLSSCQVLICEEMTLSASIKDTIKSYINPEGATENKGVDVDKPVALHCSFIVMNNDIHQNNLQFRDRRFLVPDLTSEDLSTFWKIDKIQAFSQAWKEDADKCRNFFSWLYHNFSDGESREHTKTETFKSIVHQSYPRHFTAFLDALIQNESGTFSVTINRGGSAKVVLGMVDLYKKEHGISLCDYSLRENSSGTKELIDYRSHVFGKKLDKFGIVVDSTEDQLEEERI